MMQQQSNVDRAKIMKSVEHDLVEIMRAQGLNPAECLACASIILLRFVALATASIDDDEKALAKFHSYMHSLEPQYRNVRKSALENLSPALRVFAGMAFKMGVASTSENIKTHHRAIWDQV